MFKRILVPVDGSPTSGKALTTTLALAKDEGASVRVIHAFDELTYVGGYEYSASAVRSAREQADKLLDDAQASARAAGVECDRLLIDKPAQRLGEAVTNAARDWNADLIVVGTHGRRGIGRVLLGSGAEQIIRSAAVPVLVVRSDA